MNYTYAGIGSRKTPEDVLKLFERIGKFLAEKDFTLRSGHAEGADTAFENGCDLVKGEKEIYLPWENFEDSDSKLIVTDKVAFEIAEKHHPYWHNLSEGARKLQARNSHQVLGWDLVSPSDFVICWTENGKGKGGTGQAIRIANSHKIPVFDAGFYSNIYEIALKFKAFLIYFSFVKEKEFEKQIN